MIRPRRATTVCRLLPALCLPAVCLPAVCLPALCLAACSLHPLPKEPPPLRDMEEPIALKQEPEDEAQRRSLPQGCFSGLHVAAAWFEEPDEPGRTPDALAIERIVENSPAVAGGLQVGDLLLAARAGEGAWSGLAWPSQWRKIEADSAPGTVVELRFDRANVERTAKLTLAPRVAPAVRSAAETFRETRSAGIVVRTATEVEARRAGLGAGGGAVLIGMAANSPWRQAGLQFGDVIASVGGSPLHDPQALLGAIRTTPADGSLVLEYLRGEERRSATVPMTSRQTRLSSFSIPLLFSYESGRGTTKTSFLFGFLGYESTPAAWEFCFLWFICARGGDSDLLREVKR